MIVWFARLAAFWVRHPSRYVAYVVALTRGAEARHKVVDEDARRYGFH